MLVLFVMQCELACLHENAAHTIRGPCSTVTQWEGLVTAGVIFVNCRSVVFALVDNTGWLDM